MNTERKTITLIELFSEEQLQKAVTIAKHYTPGSGKSLAELLCDRVVNEAMPHINEVTGQQNVAMYWAYALEYALTVYNGSNAP
jgi:hypothetical protein